LNFMNKIKDVQLEKEDVERWWHSMGFGNKMEKNSFINIFLDFWKKLKKPTNGYDSMVWVSKWWWCKRW
jgi:hypothetical protein